MPENTTLKPSVAETAIAMNQALAAEQKAEQAIAECRGQASAVLEEARRKAQRIQQRTNRRISRISQRFEQRLAEELKPLSRVVTDGHLQATPIADVAKLQQVIEAVADELLEDSKETT